MPNDVLRSLLIAAKQFCDHMVSEDGHMDVHDLQATPDRILDNIADSEDVIQHVPTPLYSIRTGKGNWHNHAPNSGKMQPFIACSVIVTFLVLIVLTVVTHNFWAALASIGVLANALRKVINYYF